MIAPDSGKLVEIIQALRRADDSLSWAAAALLQFEDGEYFKTTATKATDALYEFLAEAEKALGQWLDSEALDYLEGRAGKDDSPDHGTPMADQGAPLGDHGQTHEFHGQPQAAAPGQSASTQE